MTFRGIIGWGQAVRPADLSLESSFTGMRAAPLDGVVIDMMTNSGVQLSIDTLNVSRQFKIEDLTSSIDLLRYRRDNGQGKCSYNLIKVQFSSPAGLVIDPFSADYSIVYEKLVLLGKAAALAGCYGVMLDVEPYINIWRYSTMPLKDSYTFAQYQAKYYEIGYALAYDWRGYSRALNVFVTEAYHAYAQGGPPYESNTYGLEKNFLDGLLDGWGDYYYRYEEGGSGKVVVTSEGTFGELSAANIIRYGLGQIDGTFDPAAPPPDRNYWGGSRYFFDSNVIDRGLALWLDKPSFDPLTPNANYWTPATFGSQLGIILDRSVWCWIFTSDYRFFSGVSPIPDVYIDAINTQRTAHGLPTTT